MIEQLTNIFNSLLQDPFLSRLLFASVVFALSMLFFRVFKFSVVVTIRNLATKTSNKFDDLIIEIINSIHWPFYLLLSLFLALLFISVPPYVNIALNFAILFAVTYYVVRGIEKVVDFFKDGFILKRKGQEKASDTSVIELVGRAVKGIIWGFALLFVLANLGYDISTLIAGFGIGGIAIAFALQNILSDVFASFSIYFDKPFKQGDFIILGADMGVVKKIGIKSTRIQTLQGQELVVSNKELTETRVNNYGKMQKRRVVFKFGVLYETPTKKLKKIIPIVGKILSGIEHAALDRVHFKEFGDFSLNYEVVYYIDASDYTLYMDIQQAINLALKKAFEKEKIEFAYPTQTIYLEKNK